MRWINIYIYLYIFTKNVSQPVTKKNQKLLLREERNVNPFKSFYKFPIIKLLQINSRLRGPPHQSPILRFSIKMH